MTTRREFLVLAGSALAAPAAAQLPPKLEALRRATLQEALRKVTGGAAVAAGRVKLSIPPLIDNGNSVPVTVSVDSPMTPADHVKAIHLFTETNPQPYVLSAYFGPRAGRAAVTMRCRIADTGMVIALAQLSDGSFWSERADVVVTLPACQDEGTG